MEPTNCIKEVLRAANQYTHNNGQLAYLLRQLEALQTISSRSSYIRQLHSIDLVELADCLTFLVDVIREEHGQIELMQRVIKILLNFSHDDYVRKLLFETYSLHTHLAAVIVAYSGLTEEENTLAEALQLLQRITYGYRIDYYQPNMDDLLKFIINNILNNTEAFISSSLGTLANLCRNNFLVQSTIRNMYQSDFKKILRALCNFFDNQNQSLVIFSLRIFTSLCLNESEGQKLFFESNNVEQTMQAIFGVLKNSFKTVAWKYAADLLTDLIRHPQMQICINKYRHLSKCMKDILLLLPAGSDETAAEMFELLLSLCTVPSIRQCINSSLFTPLAQGKVSATEMSEVQQTALKPDTNILLCCIHWAAQEPNLRSRAPCLALDFLFETCQDSICSTESYPVHLLTPVFTDFLTRPDQTNSPEKTVRIIKILNVLCSKKQSKDTISTLLTLDSMANLLEKQLSAASSYLPDSVEREESTQCGLLTLDLAWKLRKCIQGLSECLKEVLKSPRMMSLIAVGLMSTCQDHVEIALRLMCFVMGFEDATPDISLCGTVACLNKQKESLKRSRKNSETIGKQAIISSSVLESKENRVQPLTSTSYAQVENKSKGNSKNETSYDKNDLSLESLIEKMESIMESKEPKVVEIVEVFEHHIKSLQIKEEHLNNLLEAKSLALTQADRVIAQLRATKVSHSAEMKKLQNILKESERKTEHIMSQMNEAKINADKIQEQYEKQLSSFKEEMDALNKEKDEATEKCMELEETIMACKRENKTLLNMKEALQEAHEVLKDQYDMLSNQCKQLEEERKSLSKQLKEKDASLQKINSTLQVLQSKYDDTEKERSELEKEKEDIEAYVDKLRNQLSTSENSCRQLQQRATTLEGINQEQVEKIKQKTDKISELEAELEKHNQILSFINNMQLKSTGNKK
ncbi:protein CIP2A homolog [Physella acuta]|uniref:protein CIP2A homolog n=1 Tax=Physella acuta TaxID=109671 RepID=UPI0027DB618D|nr:protein CIP2A homolog [Physella acuta]XP_059144311.1 protein CIP2A homolog [Physella acuta]XP_059144312.1 protein CIP2A homolog [Physella acuta]